MAISPSEDPPFQIHQIFSCAFYRNGRSSYAISTPAIGSHPKGTDRKFAINCSPFREDAFSYPDCNKIVISWANVNSLGLSDVARPTGPNLRSSLGPHPGALYINNLIVGTGYQKTPSAICGSNAPNTLDAEMTGIVNANEVSIPYITVEDVFNAFERDHPELKDRKAGEAKIVGFHHVFHPGVGARAGSHFEVEWLWVEDGA
ncbi:hypothetical protein H072_5840 [Dactylellina haptotyla CBS 200.50]|uniref:Uncharacterized protein n=1 Tax=Dactylellina haptotyla (strain CBS 200.50) TaxID=1284197 RepID=S8BYE1_DACHA|nr:hypothetical protein H072_5840 [Dactylellina haptotyla CBS 200.50]